MADPVNPLRGNPHLRKTHGEPVTLIRIEQTTDRYGDTSETQHEVPVEDVMFSPASSTVSDHGVPLIISASFDFPAGQVPERGDQVQRSNGDRYRVTTVSGPWPGGSIANVERWGDGTDSLHSVGEGHLSVDDREPHRQGVSGR